MTGKIIFGEQGKPDRYFIDRKEVTKEEWDAAFPPKPMAANGECSLRGWSRPIESDALAVHPRQIAAVMERNRQRGLNIQYNPKDGRPILTSREERRKLMAVEGVHDNNGGYGDDTPGKGGCIPRPAEPDEDIGL